jgi:dolichol-phosphate mannosyltransferase
MNIKISIIIPTLNEEKNIFKIYYKIKKYFLDKSYEIIFVDDKSSDNTRHKILSLSKQYSNVRYIFRKERNLSTAFLDGVNKAKGKYIVLMDSDLQHSPNDINKMLNILNNTNYNFVIGSRFLKNSQNYSVSIKSKIRILLSKLFIFLINIIFKIKISDPLSGFFICKKDSLKDNRNLYKNGFKILLDYLIVKKNKLKIKEIPITINKRLYGNSKLNIKIFLIFIKQCYFHLSR